jgi:DNA-binding NarL/FixJ family response regulator
MSTWDNLIAEGVEKGIEIPVINAFKKGKSIEEIASFMDLSVGKVKEIIEKYKKSLGQN